MKKFFALAVIIPLMFSGVSHAQNIEGIIREALNGLKFTRNFESVADQKEESRIPGMSRKILMIIGGAVECGIDTEKIQAEIVSDDKAKTLSVRLPHAEVRKVFIRNDGTYGNIIRVYDETVGVLAKHFTLEEQNKILSIVVKTLREKAMSEWQVIQEIDSEAAALITAIAKGLGYSADVTFIDAK